MSSIIVEDRRATSDELRAHRQELFGLATELGLSNLRLRDDAAVIVTATRRGYWDIASFVDQGSEIVGAYVYVVADSAPGIESAVTTPL